MDEIRSVKKSSKEQPSNKRSLLGKHYINSSALNGAELSQPADGPLPKALKMASEGRYYQSTEDEEKRSEPLDVSIYDSSSLVARIGEDYLTAMYRANPGSPPLDHACNLSVSFNLSAELDFLAADSEVQIHLQDYVPIQQKLEEIFSDTGVSASDYDFENAVVTQASVKEYYQRPCSTPEGECVEPKFSILVGSSLHDKYLEHASFGRQYEIFRESRVTPTRDGKPTPEPLEEFGVDDIVKSLSTMAVGEGRKKATAPQYQYSDGESDSEEGEDTTAGDCDTEITDTEHAKTKTARKPDLSSLLENMANYFLVIDPVRDGPPDVCNFRTQDEDFASEEYLNSFGMVDKAGLRAGCTLVQNPYGDLDTLVLIPEDRSIVFFYKNNAGRYGSRPFVEFDSELDGCPKIFAMKLPFFEKLEEAMHVKMLNAILYQNLFDIRMYFKHSGKVGTAGRVKVELTIDLELWAWRHDRPLLAASSPNYMSLYPNDFFYRPNPMKHLCLSKLNADLIRKFTAVVKEDGEIGRKRQEEMQKRKLQKLSVP